MKALIRWISRLLPPGAALLLALVPLVGASAQTGGEQIRITQVDNSKFPQVTLYVSVTDGSGNPLPVDPSQIQVFENGKVMSTDQVSGAGEIGPLTTLLVVDISGSMNSSGKIAAARDAANAYINQMRPGDQAGVLSFNTTVTYDQPITADHSALQTALANLSPHGNTAMYDALAQAVQVLQNVSGRKAIIVLTDGIDNASQQNADGVIQAIGSGGLSISTIGFGNPQESSGASGLDEATLRSLAGRAGGIYGFANDPGTLRSVYEHLGQTLQSEYKITYTSPLTLRDGLNRTLTVSLLGSASTQAKYNPGGVLPEVSGGVSRPLFLLLLAGLVVLLFVPMILSRITTLPGNLFTPKKKINIKLK
jgi:Ca-activated chloride channel family protein